MTLDTHRFFEVPPEDVDEPVRRQASRWAERAAADLALAGLGIPAVAIRWFLHPDRLRAVHPGRKELDVLSGPPTMAGQCRPGDPPGTIWLRGDLAPTLAHQQLAHYVAHELMHARSHALGRPWPRADAADVEAEARCEAFAREFCTRLRAASPDREETPMPGYTVINGRLVPETEDAARRRIKARLQGLVAAGASPAAGHADPAATAASFRALIQGAALATSAAEVGGLLTVWRRALDAEQLTGAEADVALTLLETAHQRLAGVGPAPAPGQAKATPREAALPSGGGPRGIEYSAPLPIGRLY